jgi:chromosome segregation ATPase
MAVICCATPSELYLEETRSTLQFASRAKLVKTNAQVNEVLDDRSIIRRLQRDLAEARRLSSVPGTEHMRALEDKAATAGTVAKESKAKLIRLKESILNAGYLFGNQNTLKAAGLDSEASEERNNSRKSRKRRQSDGALFLSHESPTKLDLQMATSPKTAPRKRKQKVHRQMLSPTSELHIVREALSSRNNLTRTLQKSVNDHVQLLQKKDTELEKVVSQNDYLGQDRIETHNQVESMRQDFNAALLAYEKALEEKESVIIASVEKLEKFIQEKEVLETVNSHIRDEHENLREVTSAEMERFEEETSARDEQIRDLQQRFSSLQEEGVRSAFEIAQCTTEKEKLLNEREADKKTIHEMAGKVEFLTSNMTDAERERDNAVQEINSLEAQLQSTCQENSSMTERIATLENEMAKSVSENSVLKNGVDKSIVLISKLKGENNVLEEQLTSISEKAETSQSQNENLETHQLELEECLADLSRDHELSRQDNAELEMKLKTLEGETAGMNRLLRVEEEKTSALVAEKETTGAALAGLESDKSAAESEQEALREELTESKSEIETLVAEISSVKAHAACTETRLQEIEEVVRAEEVKTSALVAENESTGAALATLESEKSAAESELEILREELVKSKSETETLVAEISNILPPMLLAPKLDYRRLKKRYEPRKRK